MWDLYILIAFLGFLIYYLWGPNQNHKAPPGPRPWPIVGNLFHIGQASDNMTLAFSELSKIYGEIFSLRMGMKKTVVLTSREAIETVFTHELSLARDRSGAFNDRCFGKNIGIGFSDGPVWERTRAWVLKNLKEYGFGKTSEMEHLILKATEGLFDEIDKQMKTHKMVSVELLHSFPIFSIMWELMVQRLSEEDKQDIKILSDKSEKWLRNSFFCTGLVNAYPIFRHLFPKTLGYDVQLDFFNTSNEITKKIYLETKAILEKENRTRVNPHTFVEAFAQKSVTDDLFDVQHFQIVFQDFFLASAETTSSFMEFIILFLILHPDMQEKIYEEIKQVSPTEEFLSYGERKKMVYTQAFILETHRNGRILQNFVPRRALGDISYKDYVIKKDTIILADTYLYYSDEKLWKDAQTFRPDRFINDKGELCNASDIISFSFGKRNCPGELYANVVSFLFLTGLVQRYKISIPQGQPRPTTELRPGIAFKTMPFKACYNKRIN